MKAVLIGISASFFFAITFVFNRLMMDGGGSWMWSASLRFLFMIPLLFGIVAVRKGLPVLFREIKMHPWLWMWWSFVGFGLFYAPLCIASAYSPAWMVAGSWQFTIIAGSLVVPLFYDKIQTAAGIHSVRKKIPIRGMGMSLVILLGIVCMEWSQSSHVSLRAILLGILPVLVASFAYPLGNRKMMVLCEGRIDAYQRTLGMTISSLPLWLMLSIFQLSRHGPPSMSQSIQCLVVAIFSGAIATVLFFTATDLAEGNVHKLATVEATQSGEVVFTLIGEILLIPRTNISVFGGIGLGLVVVGMILHSLVSGRRPTQLQESMEASS